MLTEKDYCDWRTVKDLESLGMNVYTKVKGIDVLKSVLLYQAQKYLREEKGLFVEVVMSYGKYDFDICSTKLEQNMTHKILCEIWGYKTYEEALSEGVRASIKILQDEQKENN